MDMPVVFDEWLRRRRPALVGFLLWIAGFLGIAAVLVLIGLFITHGPLHGPIARWDRSITRWVAARETGMGDSLTSIGSTLGMTQVIIGIELLALIVLAILRRLRDLAFLVTALTLEAAVALMASTIVDRPRPSLIRLEVVPPTKSFPSGHTAAAIVLYVGLAILMTPHVRNRFLRTVIWVIALLLPVYVGVSRIYRGMHHATDVLGSVLLGLLSLGIARLIVAYTASVWRDQHRRTSRPASAEPDLNPAQLSR